MSIKETLRKLYYRYSPTSWLILLTSFIESTLIIIIQLVVLIGANIKDPLINGVPVYLIIFIGSRLFQFGLIIDGIKNKNTIQLIAINIFNFLSFIYSIVEINQITKVINDSKDVEYPSFILPLLYTSSSILVLAQCFYVWLAYKLYLSFGWDIYKIIGANPRLRKMLLNYHIFLLLLKLDVFFFFGFSLQFLMMILKSYDPEFWLTILALPLTLIILLLAIYGVRNENKSFMFAFIAGLLVAMIYFIFKIVKIYQPSNYEKYKYSKIILTLFASISLFVLGLTAIQSYICYRNFGNGLRDHIKNSSNMKYLIKPTERTLNLDED